MAASLLSPDARRFILAARRAVLATLRAQGPPRVVPVCFALLGEQLVSVVDDKPKASRDPYQLGRVSDLLERPDVSVLFDRWHEDWRRLAWVRIDGVARVVPPGAPGHGEALDALRDRYTPYRSMDLADAPVITIDVRRVVSWGDVAGRRLATDTEYSTPTAMESESASRD